MRPVIIPKNIYHVMNRGVDKRKIFMDDKDRLRFVHNLFEFNDENPVLNVGYFFNKNIDVKHQYVTNRSPRKLLVDILAFSIMPNHYHLLLRPRSKTGISLFIKKLNGGYVKYFNERYNRSGTLFQGRYKMVPITKDAHLIHIPYYIHLNPLDIKFPEWRKRELRDYKDAIKYLDSYRWSSHLDYTGKNNFPFVTDRKFFLDMFNGAENYKKDIKKWIESLKNEYIKEIVLE